VWRTLDVLPWQTWLERWFIDDRRAGRIAGRWVSQRFAALVWRRLIDEDPLTSRLVSADGLARAGQQSWRRLHAYAIPLSALTDSDSVETRAFARWANRYADWLRGQRATDADTVADVLHAERLSGALRLVGFDTLTPQQSALIERLRGAGITVEGDPVASTRGSVMRVECDDRRAELEAAARWAAARLDRNADSKLAIIVPELAARSESVRRELERVLSPASGLTGGPMPGTRAFELAAASPLSTRPAVAAAFDWLQASIAGVDPAGSSRLLRSHYVAGADEERAARAMLDVWLRRRPRAELTLAQLGRLAAEHDCLRLAQLLMVAAQRSAGWPRRTLPSAWSQWFFEQLTAMGWPGEREDSVEHQTAERWQALLAGLGCADEVVGAIGAQDALRLLRDDADAALFEPREIDTPLLVIDPQTCAGMRFDALWITGMESAQWPPPAAPDPFLPREWQVRREVPGATAELAARHAARTFERLLASAEEVVASVARFDGEAPILPSSLLTSLAPYAELPGWSVPLLAQRIHAARPALEVIVDARFPAPIPGPVTRGGARLFELLSACPFRAGAELRLGARALDEPGPGIDAATRGTLVHRVLARLWSELRDQQTLLGCDSARLAELVRAAIEIELEPLWRGAGAVLRRLLEVEADWLVARALELADCERRRVPFSVEAVETQRTVALGDLTVVVQPDRIDRLADGSLAVIDYKTGSEADVGGWIGERPRAPQLPLYAHAVGADRVAAIAIGRLRAGRTGFVGIARDARIFGLDTDFAAKRALRGIGSWTELLAQWGRRLESLASEYVRGDARLAWDPQRACRYCHLPGLCRIDSSAIPTERGSDET
jgi:probable DNA repair protein